MELEVVPSEWIKRMCKKIATLTKVIYSLNVRLSDADHVIEWLKQTHEEQMRQLAEKLDHESEQCRMKAHREEMLQKEVVHLKQQLEKEKEAAAKWRRKRRPKNEQLVQSRLQRDIDQKKDEVIRKVEELHELQKQLLRFAGAGRCNWAGSNAEDGDSPDSGCKVSKPTIDAELHEEEVRAWKEKYERANREKAELVQSYEIQLAAVKAMHEKYLAPPADESVTGQNSAALTQRRVDELLQSLTQSEEQAERYRRSIRELTEVVTVKDKQIEVMQEQISVMKEELSRLNPRLRQAESALAVLRDTCSKQSQEILAKKYKIESLEATVSEMSLKMNTLGTAAAGLDGGHVRASESNQIPSDNSSRTNTSSERLEATGLLPIVAARRNLEKPKCLPLVRPMTKHPGAHRRSPSNETTFPTQHNAEDWEVRLNVLKSKIKFLLHSAEPNTNKAETS